MWDDFYLNIELIHPNAKMPTRAHEPDAGLDVYLLDDIVIYPGEVKMIPLGFRIEFPKGYVVLMKDKGGRAVKDKLTNVANVIDSGYTGECHAVIYKMGGPVEIHKAGEKIAQMVVFPCWTGQPVQVEKINMKTSRGEGKLGSTGLT